MEAPAGVDVGDVASLGQASTGHPLLGATVALADGRNWLFTGRLGLDVHPWLADHAAMGVVLLPGTAFVELVLRAGREVGCDALEELVLEAPLVLDERDGVQVQVSVGEPDEDGRRSVDVYSRSQDAAGDDLWSEGQPWARNASGVLAAGGGGPAGASVERVEELAGDAWPPAGAEIVEVESLYDRLAELGLDYGPVFQGLRGIWRRGEEVFAEVALPEDQREQAGEFGLHPALLDAAFHAMGVGLLDDGGENGARSVSIDAGRVPLPFSWGGVRLYATGASGLRVRLSRVGSEGVSLVAADEKGELVVSVDSLVTRTVSAEALDGAGRGHTDSLFFVDWTAVPVTQSTAVVSSGGDWAVLGGDGAEHEDAGLVGALEGAGLQAAAYDGLESLGEALDLGEVSPAVVFVDCGSHGDLGVVGVAHVAVCRVLGLVQAWLVDERFSAVRLVVVTRGAVAACAGEGVGGLALAPVWGLVRSAQMENPGRFVLVDLDGDDGSVAGEDGFVAGEDASVAVLGAALALDEPQFALRGGVVFVPRLARVPALAGEGVGGEAVPVPVSVSGSVLITGGTSGLGALLARHLVAVCGVRSVVLASRRGREAEGAGSLRRS